jgi:hypothetical protein
MKENPKVEWIDGWMDGWMDGWKDIRHIGRERDRKKEIGPQMSI